MNVKVKTPTDQRSYMRGYHAAEAKCRPVIDNLHSLLEETVVEGFELVVKLRNQRVYFTILGMILTIGAYILGLITP